MVSSSHLVSLISCSHLSDGYAGYCIAPDLCCAEDEELCYSDDWIGTPESCALISEGGCPCPEGETKCGSEPDLNYSGYCTSLCWEEQTCYDLNSYQPTSCAAWGEDCPAGIPFRVIKGNDNISTGQSNIETLYF